MCEFNATISERCELLAALMGNGALEPTEFPVGTKNFFEAINR